MRGKKTAADIWKHGALTQWRSGGAFFFFFPAAPSWQSDHIPVMAATATLESGGLGFCAGGSLKAQSTDAEIPETSFYCCIKAERQSGDGPLRSELS